MDFFTEPLFDAVAKGDQDAMVHLLNIGASLHNVDESGLTALHWTASSPYGDSLIPLMISRGADINAVDNYGRTPLHLLSALGRVNGVTCLLFHGADVTIREDHQSLLAVDYAIIHGHDDVIKLLLAHGAKPTEYVKETGKEGLGEHVSINDSAAVDNNGGLAKPIVNGGSDLDAVTHSKVEDTAPYDH